MAFQEYFPPLYSGKEYGGCNSRIKIERFMPKRDRRRRRVESWLSEPIESAAKTKVEGQNGIAKIARSLSKVTQKP